MLFLYLKLQSLSTFADHLWSIGIKDRLFCKEFEIGGGSLHSTIGNKTQTQVIMSPGIEVFNDFSCRCTYLCLKLYI